MALESRLWRCLTQVATPEYREAVTSQSPGLLQPWREQNQSHQPGTGCARGRNRVAVEPPLTTVPRVAATATLGS